MAATRGSRVPPSLTPQLWRKLALNTGSLRIKPMTDEATANLTALCPCGGTWTTNTQRTLTTCPADSGCVVPWINYSNVGAVHYGMAKVWLEDAVDRRWTFPPTR
jgi:hypothetical protein